MSKGKLKTISICQTPRAMMGWPCFYCATRLKVCQKTRGRCCRSCKGKGSH